MKRKRIAVIRVRGRTGICKELKDTLKLLRITRINHCSLINNSPEYLGMLNKCKDYITWGEIDTNTFTLLINKRGRLKGNKKFTKEVIENAGFNSLSQFAEKFMNFECELSDIKVKPVFRLHPPRKGHTHIKRRYPYGALGYRGEEINELIRRMV